MSLVLLKNDPQKLILEFIDRSSGKGSHFYYDIRGNVSQVENTLGSMTQYFYNRRGNKLTETHDRKSNDLTERFDRLYP